MFIPPLMGLRRQSEGQYRLANNVTVSLKTSVVREDVLRGGRSFSQKEKAENNFHGLQD